jgi:regulator of sigma E protease
MMLSLALLDGLGNFALFLAALGFIIFVHELGHFMTAKWVGIKVEQFALGFGHVVVCWRKGLGFRVGSTKKEVEKRINDHLHRTHAPLRETEEHVEAEGVNVTSKEQTSLPSDSRIVDQAMQELGIGETEYSIRWFPLGGFVKMLGQDDLDPTKVSPDPRSYNNKPIWARMIVVSAGVVVNMIFAVVFFIAAFMWGVAFPPAIVGGVIPGSPAANAQATNADGVVGLQPGDEIVSINGEEPSDFAELKVATALSKAGQPLNLIVERPAFGDQPEQTLRFSMKPETNEDKFLQIGVLQAESIDVPDAKGAKDRQALAEVLAKKGIEPGMKLVAVNGQPVTEQWQYLLALQEASGKPVMTTFARKDGTEKQIEAPSVTALPTSKVEINDDETNEQRHLLGFEPATRISYVVPDSPADGQLEVGDHIKAIGDVKWPSVSQSLRAIREAGRSPVKIELLRDGQTVSVEVTPRGGFLGFLGTPKIGVAFTDAVDDQLYLAAPLEDSPAAALNLAPGTRLASVNGKPIASYSEFRMALEESGPGTVEIGYIEPLLGGTEGTAELALSEDDFSSLQRLPWRDSLGVFEPRRDMQKTSSPTEALAIGYDKTVLFLQQTYITMARLFEGSVSAKHLSGPVGITHAGMTMADRGFAYLFWFMGLISVNLAVINFLPLPIVDGGLFVMLLIEKLRGKPLPIQVQSAITMAGLVLLGAVFLFVTFNDIARLIGG